jgi:hypothetical protein
VNDHRSAPGPTAHLRDTAAKMLHPEGQRNEGTPQTFFKTVKATDSTIPFPGSTLSLVPCTRVQLINWSPPWPTQMTAFFFWRGRGESERGKPSNSIFTQGTIPGLVLKLLATPGTVYCSLQPLRRKMQPFLKQNNKYSKRK